MTSTSHCIIFDMFLTGGFIPGFRRTTALALAEAHFLIEKIGKKFGCSASLAGSIVATFKE